MDLLPAMIVFLLCGVGIYRDSVPPESLALPLRSHMRGPLTDHSMICFHCEATRDCVAAHRTMMVRAIMARCGVAGTTLPARSEGESLYFRVSENGGLSMKPFPVALSVAFGLQLRPSRIPSLGWQLVPGVGKVLSERIHDWQQAVSKEDPTKTRCNLEEVAGIGPTRAEGIRTFLGLMRDCETGEK